MIVDIMIKKSICFLLDACPIYLPGRFSLFFSFFCFFFLFAGEKAVGGQSICLHGEVGNKM